ncbi:MAG: hypothetical protein K0S01_464 [Herbinix sp.]|nr:hypothetical protein [Herbinix sp.]
MPIKNNNIIELSNPDYVPVVKDADTFYGGSQMWFPEKHWYSKDYILHNYGCGTIATADMFLYLALQNKDLKTPITELALQGEPKVNYSNYDPYVRTIHDNYTKTRHIIAVLGPAIASAINSYSSSYGLHYHASWKWSLTYYDMYELIEEMLHKDIPVILSIGPNTPKLWGKKGIPFYERREIDYQENADQNPEVGKPYYYKMVKQNVNGHYVTVTGLIKDVVTERIMLRISSWGKQYYINYEEYRDYIENNSGTFTSSIVYVKRFINK